MMQRLSLAMVFCFCATCAWAAMTEKEGAAFSNTIRFEGHDLDLQGVGVKYFLFFKVFVAGYYTGHGPDAAQKIEVAYFYHVPAHKLAVETRRRMRLNLSTQQYARVKSRIDAMDRYFVDIKPGDRYSLLYIPGTGTHFIYNGKDQGIIPGADFAQGLFAVWVGQYPIDKKLKSQLLTRY